MILLKDKSTQNTRQHGGGRSEFRAVHKLTRQKHCWLDKQNANNYGSYASGNMFLEQQ